MHEYNTACGCLNARIQNQGYRGSISGFSSAPPHCIVQRSTQRESGRDLLLIIRNWLMPSWRLRSPKSAELMSQFESKDVQAREFPLTDISRIKFNQLSGLPLA